MQALECVHSDKPYDESDFLCKSKQTLSDLNILKKALSVPHFILWWCVLQQCMVFSLLFFFSSVHLNSVAITLTLRFWNTGTHRWQTLCRVNGTGLLSDLPDGEKHRLQRRGHLYYCHSWSVAGQDSDLGVPWLQRGEWFEGKGWLVRTMAGAFRSFAWGFKVSQLHIKFSFNNRFAFGRVGFCYFKLMKHQPRRTHF